MGIGFETTAPAVAAAMMPPRRKGIRESFPAFPSTRRVPAAIDALLNDPHLQVDGFHLSRTCQHYYRCRRLSGHPCGRPGLCHNGIRAGRYPGRHPHDPQAMPRQRHYTVAIQYGRGVKREGNLKARQIMMDVFEETDGYWRGLGVIPLSGLALRDTYRAFDARERFDIPSFDSVEPQGCACGDILRGIRSPGRVSSFRNGLHAAQSRRSLYGFFRGNLLGLF